MTRAAEAGPVEPGRLVGTWRLAGSTALDTEGRPLPPPYGPEPIGLITFTATGRLMAVTCDGRSFLPDGATREFGAYSGMYTFDGATLVVAVDVSNSPRAAIGSRQVRRVRFESEILVLTPPPTVVGSVMQQRELFWERVSCLSA